MQKLSTKKKISYKLKKKLRLKNPIVFNTKALEPRVTINFSKNNIFFNISCRLQKEPNLYSIIYWASTGSHKFSTPPYKGSAKISYLSNYYLGIVLSQKLLQLRMKSIVSIVFKGSGSYFKVFLNSFKLHYRKKFNLFDLTPIALNGCRLKKARRV